MPLPLIAELYDLVDVSSPSFRYAAIGLLVFITLRVWSATPPLRVRRVLHGRTVVISGGLSPISLASVKAWKPRWPGSFTKTDIDFLISLTRSLASQGAQIILLHKDPSSAILQQLLELIRSTTANERIYAESCDVSGSSPEALDSIRKFTSKWCSLQKKSPLGDDLGPEKIDTLILAEDESLANKHTFGADKSISMDFYNTEVTGKIALVEGLLPALRSSKTRIVNIVSPFYAASPPLALPGASSTQVPADLVKQIPWRSFQPWTFSASSSLCSIAAFTNLAEKEAGPEMNLPAMPDIAPRERKITIVSVAPSVTRAWIADMFKLPIVPLDLVLKCILLPFIYPFGISVTNAAMEVERAIHGDFLDLDRYPNGVPNGSLVAKGKTVRLTRAEVVDPSFGDFVWESETRKQAASSSGKKTKKT